MSRHLQDLLADLKERIARMGALVQQHVEHAAEAIATCNAALAEEVIHGDRRIDDDEVKVEQAAIDLLALHQPAASDLRLVTSIIKANADLERIADCAVNAAQRVAPLARQGDYACPGELRRMANAVVGTLRDTIKAFNLGDADLARKVVKGDDAVDATYHQIVQEMLTEMEGHAKAANTLLSNIMIAKNLERIADHCTNIAEDVIYVQSGRIVRHLHAV